MQYGQPKENCTLQSITNISRNFRFSQSQKLFHLYKMLTLRYKWCFFWHNFFNLICVCQNDSQSDVANCDMLSSNLTPEGTLWLKLQKDSWLELPAEQGCSRKNNREYTL